MEHDLPSDRRRRGLRARGRDGLWIGLYGLRLRRRIRMRDDLRAKLGPVPPGSLRAHLFAQKIEVALVLDPRRPPPLPRHRRRARLAVLAACVAPSAEQQLEIAAETASRVKQHGGRKRRPPRTGPLPTRRAKASLTGSRGVHTPPAPGRLGGSSSGPSILGPTSPVSTPPPSSRPSPRRSGHDR